MVNGCIFRVGVSDLSYHHLLLLRTVVFKWAIKMGQIEAHICPRTWEQKVDVSHSRGAQGEAVPLGICPQQRIAETGNSVAQDFCNTKACPPALALRGHSQQSAPLQPGPEHWIHCLSFVLLEPLLRFNFFIPPTQWQHLRGANERQRPFVDVWHSILQFPIKGSWLALKKNVSCLVLAEWTRYKWASRACDTQGF